MSTNFPTSLDTLSTSRGTTGQPLSSPNHITHHTNEDDAIAAIEAKIGVDSSAVTSSLDYKVSHIPIGSLATTGSPSSTKVLKGDYSWGTSAANFSTTQVFSGTSPTVFTDLANLPAMIGGVQRVVMLVVTTTSGSSRKAMFQRKGTSYSFPTTNGVTNSGASMVITLNANPTSQMVIVATDANGAVQWATDSAVAFSINLEAYW